MKILPLNTCKPTKKPSFKGDIIYFVPNSPDSNKFLKYDYEMLKYFYNESDIMENSHIRFMNTKLPPVMQTKKTPSINSSYYMSDNPNVIPWEMCIFADNEHDFQALALTVGHYLADNDLTFDILSDVKSVNSNNLDPYTKGKVITIYPSSKEQFEKIATDINFIVDYNRLNTKYSKIKGARPFGSSGRIFYRYGLNSKLFKDMTFNCSSEYENILYTQNKQPIRDRYMADDMTSHDDPWR